MGKKAVTKEETPVAEREPEAKKKKEAEGEAEPVQSKEKKPKKQKKQAKEDVSSRMPWGRTLVPALLFIAGSGFLLYQHDPCDIKSTKRKDCGFSGISHFGCLSRGYARNPFKSSDRYLPIKAHTKKVVAWSELGIGQLKEMGKFEEFGSPKVGSPIDETKLNVEAIMKNGMGEMKDGGPSVQVLFDQADGSFKVDKKNLPGKAEGIGYRASPKYDDPMKDMSYAVWGGIVKGEVVAGGKWLKVSSSSIDDPHSMRLQQFGLLLAKLFATAVALWFVSGYPIQSLGWYAIICAGLALRFNMCCYNEEVKDAPHCYMGGTGPF